MALLDLIKETISQFKRGADPKQSLGIGTINLIKKWFLEHKIDLDNLTIEDDYSITSNSSILFPATNLSYGIEIYELPDFINFKIIYGSFDISYMKLKSLRGLPQEIHGTLYLDHNEIESLEHFPKIVKGDIFIHSNKPEKIEESKILAICDVEGVVIS